MNEMHKESKERQDSQQDIILKALKNAGSNGILNRELNEIMFRYGQIIYLLRIKGYKIKTENVGKGLVKYTLLSDKPEKEEPKKKGIDIVREQWGELGRYHIKELEDILKDNNLQIIHRPNGLNKICN